MFVTPNGRGNKYGACTQCGDTGAFVAGFAFPSIHFKECESHTIWICELCLYAMLTGTERSVYARAYLENAEKHAQGFWGWVDRLLGQGVTPGIYDSYLSREESH